MALPFEIWIDTSLGVAHGRGNCPGLKIPYRYGDVRWDMVRTVEQARSIDRRYRACEACEKALRQSRERPQQRYPNQEKLI